MKHNSVWGKILLLALSFIMAFSTLVSCTKDDIKALNDKDTEIQNSLTTTADDLAKLKTLVNQVKATADAAAAKTALDGALAALEEVKATADAAATKAALDTIKADLEAALAANGTTDASVKAALEATIAAVKATADAALSTADFSAAKEVLESALDELKATVEVNAGAASKALAEAKTALEAADAENKAALETAKTEVAQAITAANEANANALAAAKTAIEEAYKAADAENKAALEAADAALAAADGDLDKAIKALEKVVADNTVAATEAINKVAGDLAAANEANAKALADAKAALEKAINDANEANAKALADAKAELKTAYEAADATAKTELQNAITTLENTTAENLGNAVITINNTIVTLEQNVEAAKAELNSAIEKVEATANAAATKVDFDAAKAILDKAVVDVAAAATKTELEAAQGALNTAIAGVKATADAAVTTEALEAAIDAAKATIKKTTDALDARITTLEGTVKDNYDELKAALAGKADAEYVEELEKELDKVKETLENLVNEDGVIEFVAEYKLATEMLYLDNEGNDYSLDDWDRLVASISENDYMEDDFDKFTAQATTLRFFLGRAVTREEIKEYFAMLQQTISNMPTFEQTLEKYVVSFECGERFLSVADDGATEEVMGKMEVAYQSVVKFESETLEGRYKMIVDAYDNLVAANKAAADVATLIDEIEKLEFVVFVESKDTIWAAIDTYTMFEYAYFQLVPEYNNYYEAGKTTEELASALVDGYDAMRTAETRYYELTDAFDNAAEISELALGYNTARPLYTNAAELRIELDAFNTWVEYYKLQDENVKAIYAELGYGDYTLIEKATVYAEAMAAVYDAQKVDALREKLAAVLAVRDDYIYSDKTDIEEVYNLVNDAETGLLAAIAEVPDFEDDIDANFEAMLPKYDTNGTEADFVTYNARLAELKAAVEEIALVAEKISAYWVAEKNAYVVGLIDFEAIQALYAERDNYESSDIIYANVTGGIVYVCYTRNINVVDAENSNYKLIISETQAAWDALFAEYGKLTDKLRKAYDSAMGILENEAYNVDYPIAYADKIIEAIGLTVDAINENGVGSAKIWLPATETSPDNEQVNFIELLTELRKAAENVAVKGAAAEEAYANDVADKIDAIRDLATNKLDNKADIDAAYAAVYTWAKAHLAVAADADDAAILAAVKLVQDMNKYDGINNKDEFVLLSTDDCQLVFNKEAEITTTYENADGEWTALKAILVELTGMTDGEKYTIHTDVEFAAAEKLYNDFRAKYYNEGSALYIYFFEDETKADFDETYKVQYAAFYKAAQDLATEIIDRINALPKDFAAYTATGSEAIRDEAAAILALIETFNATYDKECGCNVWFQVEADEENDIEAEDLILTVNKAYYMAQLMVEAVEAGLTPSKIDIVYRMYVINIISQQTTVDNVKARYNLCSEDIAAGRI